MPRVVLLVCVLAALDLWLARHTGIGLRDPRAVGGAGSVVLVFVWFAAKIANSADDAAWKWLVKRATFLALSTRSLAVLYLVAAFVMLNMSSITVIPTPEQPEGAVSLRALDAGQDTADEKAIKVGSGPVRFQVWTGPFGGTYQLRVPGYMPSALNVYPIVGRRVIPGENLARSPTVLIRPTLKALESLSICDTGEGTGNRCGRFQACTVSANGTCGKVIAKYADGHANSFLLGWRDALPHGLMQDWRLELAAREQGAGGAPAPVAKALLAWKHPVVFSPATSDESRRVVPLEPGMELRAEVHSQANALVACRRFRIESVPFMDVAMRSMLSAEECPR